MLNDAESNCSAASTEALVLVSGLDSGGGVEVAGGGGSSTYAGKRTKLHHIFAYPKLR